MQFTHREFPYSFGHWRCLLNGPAHVAVPEHALARKQIQWKPIAGYQMLALVTNGCISRSRRGGLVEFKIKEINDRASISTSSV
jgi:hypothetical protein